MRRHHRLSRYSAFALLTLAMLAAGCGITRSDQPPGASTPPPSVLPTMSPSGGPATSPSTVPSESAAPSGSAAAAPSTSPSATPNEASLAVYLLRGEYVATARRPIAGAAGSPQTAIEELLLGPTSEEKTAGLHTQIPTGAQLRSLKIENGLATIDLSGAFAAGIDATEDRARVAQVVFTLTQFPTVDGVAIRLDGTPLVFRNGEGKEQTRPLTRRAFEEITPAIFVERPAIGEAVGNTINISGTANTSEAAFVARVSDSEGKSLTEKTIRATSGSGTRGTFSAAIPLQTTATAITLELYEKSTAGGLPVHVVKIPLNHEAQ